MTAFYLENEELKENLIGKGILHEVNRTFFHPIGMALTLKYYEDHDKTELLLQSTNDDEGFTFDTVDSDKQRIFKEYSNEKYEKRQDEVGFIIQTHDIDKYKKEKKFDFKTERLNAILNLLQQFFHSVYFKFLKHSNNCDPYERILTKKQFKTKLQVAYEDEDWESVTAYAMFLRFYNNFEKEIKELVEKNSKMIEKDDISNG